MCAMPQHVYRVLVLRIERATFRDYFAIAHICTCIRRVCIVRANRVSSSRAANVCGNIACVGHCVRSPLNWPLAVVVVVSQRCNASFLVDDMSLARLQARESRSFDLFFSVVASSSRTFIKTYVHIFQHARARIIYACVHSSLYILNSIAGMTTNACHKSTEFVFFSILYLYMFTLSRERDFFDYA